MESEMLKERAAYYRRHPSELNKLTPTEQLRIARAMEPEPAPASAGYQTPHRPVAEFDDILRQKTENPEAYNAAVERLSPVSKLSFARYIESLTAHSKDEAVADKRREIAAAHQIKIEETEAAHKAKLAEMEAEHAKLVEKAKADNEAKLKLLELDAQTKREKVTAP